MKSITPELAASKLHKLSRLRPRLAMILGTAELSPGAFEIAARCPYEKVPGFAPARVTGHPGEVVIGRLAGEPVILLRGRAHYYEGHPMTAVTFGVRALAAAGVRDLLLTNAAGAINPRLRVGDLMLIRDHINFMGVNPLRGVKGPDTTRFVDLSQVYDIRLIGLLRQAARACRFKIKSGVYLAVSGPSYETPAEISAFGRLGADAVGMSTVPEAIVARQCGVKVAAVSIITNLAAGRSPRTLNHHEVIETAHQVRKQAGPMLEHFAGLYRCQSEDSD